MIHLRPTAVGRVLSLTVLIILLSLNQATAQTVIGRQNVDQYPVTSWNQMTYGLTFLPSDYASNTTQRYPLIIFLHGRGECGDGVGGLNRLLIHGLPRLISQGMNPEATNPVTGQHTKFIVVSPQAPWASQWSYAWGSIQWILADVVQRYRVDPTRVYVTGLSAGGAGAWSCTLNGYDAAQKFAAVVPVSAAGTNSGAESDQMPLAGGTYGSKIWNIAGAQESWLSFAQNATNVINSANPAPAVPAIVSAVAGGDHNDITWDAAYSVNWRANSQNKNIYEWMLQYTRGGASSPAPVPVNQAPTANAGAAQTITLPTNSVNLNGSGSDPDGSIASYQWSQVTGPANVTFGNPASAQTSVSNLVQGTYTLRLRVTDNGGLSATSDVTITVNPAPVSSTPVSSVKIEAEQWASMNGVHTEPTHDAGGGLNVGWQDNNDWMDYSVNLASSGTYALNFRVATMFTGAQFQVRRADGTVVATVNVPNTGGFQSWQTVTVNANLPAGQQHLRIYTTNAAGGWNINWWELAASNTSASAPVVSATAPSTVAATSTTLNGSATASGATITSYQWAQVTGPNNATINNPNQPSTTVSNLVPGTYTFRLTASANNGTSSSANVSLTVTNSTSGSITAIRIEAENWASMSGVHTEPTHDAGGGLNVGWQDNNDWMDYSVNLAGAGTFTMNFRIATMFTGAQFQVRNSSGAVLATVNVPNTGSFQTWQTTSAQVTLPAGQQTLRVFTTNAAGGWNINWLEIQGGSATPPPPPASTSVRIEAEDYTGMFGVVKEPTQDAGGGQNIGYQDNGDWMDYSVNLANAGTYNVNFRVATANTGAQFQVRNSAGAVLTTVTVPNTTWYQVWETTSAQIQLPAGQQTLRIFTTNFAGGWNLNWFEITSASSSTRSMAAAEVVADPAATAALELFPNPVVDRFALKVNNALTGNIQVQVINMSGAVEKSFTLKKLQPGVLQTYLSIGSLAKGNYVLSVQMNGWKETTKLIKQ